MTRKRCPALAWKQPAKRCEQHPVRRFVAGRSSLAAKDGEFMAEHQDLKFFGAVGAKDQPDELKDAAQGKIRKLPGHRGPFARSDVSGTTLSGRQMPTRISCSAKGIH